MKEFLTNSLDLLGLAWWVEIKTGNPRCTYYFGPFLNDVSAQEHLPGYVEDLEKEGAQNLMVAVKRCKPHVLTIVDASEQASLRKLASVYMG
jgi:lipid II:glycine glycyltransferase (peptidoglycan interpeptide bridge formation enzyme)